MSVAVVTATDHTIFTPAAQAGSAAGTLPPLYCVVDRRDAKSTGLQKEIDESSEKSPRLSSISPVPFDTQAEGDRTMSFIKLVKNDGNGRRPDCRYRLAPQDGTSGRSSMETAAC
jgi:hypothetical protein